MKLLALMILLSLPLAAQPVLELRETPAGATVAHASALPLGSIQQRDVVKNLWIVNTGTADLSVSTYTINATNNCTVNPVTGFPRVIAPGASSAATMVITITATSNFSFEVVVASNDPSLPNYVIDVTGTGVSAPDLRVLFGGGGVNNGLTQNIGSTWEAGGPNQFTLVLYNWGIAGSPDLTWGPGTVLTVLSSTGCSLGLAPDPTMPLATGNWIALYNSLNVPTPGPFSFTFQITTNDPDESPWSATFNGVAVNEPIIDVNGPAGVDLPHNGYVGMGVLPVGVSTTYSGSIYNAGVGPLMLTGTPVFQFTNMLNCNVTLIVTPMDTYNTAVSDLWTISIVPTAAGPYSFDLEIPNNSPATPTYVVHFVDVVPAPPPPPPAGKKDGGGDDEGCSTGQGSATWLALLAALACITVTARLRRAQDSRR